MANKHYTRTGEEKVPCRVCGILIFGVTQHRTLKHPEVTAREWSKLGEWEPLPQDGEKEVKRG